ncbi:hypothetical protein ACFY05_43235 [Microtetraspora fusca]|uniref:Uncharacterized protein n=1 Tax=Microtetraspora fusca TaxID=1997 RepID=A0ABW6VN14_MICFU
MGPINVGYALPISCDEYDMTIGSPGRYSLKWSTGWFIQQGNQEASYVQSVKVPHGAEVRWSYKQRLEMARWTYPSIPCSSTNSNQVCDPNAWMIESKGFGPLLVI